MIAHLIHYKGKGIWVLAAPMFVGLILFTVADGFAWNDKYIGAITFLLSGVILFFIDSNRKKVTEGIIVVRTVKLPREKRKNTFMWIEVRYWGILIGLIGLIWLINT
ncbi:hypothetical protein [Mucilaginibacter xinganensis]|uniref:hypothetical protein n=1 Tax=Mucilaginibacter xinganensis TaxID=1234841 RepID=UPI000B98A233|nr:hypothetical protein [Mucilaginibacter xinganensis]